MARTNNSDGDLGFRRRKRKFDAFLLELDATIDRKYGDLILLLCYFVTGLLDSASISKWGSFVSMQTGMQPAPPAHLRTCILRVHFS
jgi:hypothetical protein